MGSLRSFWNNSCRLSIKQVAGIVGLIASIVCICCIFIRPQTYSNLSAFVVDQKKGLYVFRQERLEQNGEKRTRLVTYVRNGKALALQRCYQSSGPICSSATTIDDANRLYFAIDRHLWVYDCLEGEARRKLGFSEQIKRIHLSAENKIVVLLANGQTWVVSQLDQEVARSELFMSSGSAVTCASTRSAIAYASPVPNWYAGRAVASDTAVYVVFNEGEQSFRPSVSAVSFLSLSPNAKAIFFVGLCSVGSSNRYGWNYGVYHICGRDIAMLCSGVAVGPPISSRISCPGIAWAPNEESLLVDVNPVYYFARLDKHSSVREFRKPQQLVHIDSIVFAEQSGFSACYVTRTPNNCPCVSRLVVDGDNIVLRDTMRGPVPFIPGDYSSIQILAAGIVAAISLRLVAASLHSKAKSV